jgi:hypothetical protein
MTIKMLAPFKNWKAGQIVKDATPEQAQWLVDRKYAAWHGETPKPPPLQDEPAKKPLTTRAKKKK